MLDTSVLVAGLRSRNGASHALLEAVADRRLIPLTSPPLFLEYEDVPKRPEHRLVHTLTLEEIDEFLAAFASAVEPVDLHFRWRPQVRDAGDEMVFETAVNGHADALVTHNESDYREAARRFDLRIMGPAEALRRLRK